MTFTSLLQVLKCFHHDQQLAGCQFFITNCSGSGLCATLKTVYRMATQCVEFFERQKFDSQISDENSNRGSCFACKLPFFQWLLLCMSFDVVTLCDDKICYRDSEISLGIWRTLL